MLVPGTWTGPWIWKKVAEGLRGRGHSVHLVTLSGLDRPGADVSHVGLDTHVEDVHAVVRDLAPERVVLVSHSTSGVVAGAVADREPCRVDRTVYVEAQLPHDGRSAIDAFDEPLRGDELRLIDENGGRWPAPDVDVVSDAQGLTYEEARWLTGRLRDHPGRPLTEPVRLARPLAEQRATYVVCELEHFDGRLAADVERMRSAPTWRFRTLDTGLWPMVSDPDALVALLDEVAAEVAAEDRAGRTPQITAGDQARITGRDARGGRGAHGAGGRETRRDTGRGTGGDIGRGSGGDIDRFSPGDAAGNGRSRPAWDTPGDEVGPQRGRG
ncbi:alpha/beta fold hydrolase [Actinomadura oligospora]|uniref:alpha/beta fold hydrolase n=1 Tax=Actinomadura oligospora TaxID=111804 RepID=UPI0014745ED1|nr:alpha/beta hydrolase [Actinomadura oligospora]